MSACHEFSSIYFSNFGEASRILCLRCRTITSGFRVFSIMSSCLSGGGGGGGGFVKSPACCSSSSSLASTLSESRSSQLSIATKRPRAPRKRPNQSYSEAAALLSAAYPTVFSTAKSLRKLCRHPPRPYGPFAEPPDLLPAFPALADAGFLIRDSPPVSPDARFEPKAASFYKTLCRSPPSVGRRSSSVVDEDDGFDAESILDEEVEEGIDSIMGNLSVIGGGENWRQNRILGSLVGFGLGRWTVGQALRRRPDDWDWWRSPAVAIRDIVPKFKKLSATTTVEKKKKNKKKKEVEEELDESTTAAAATTSTRSSQENLMPKLGLKLDYEDVLKAWADSGCPYSDGPPESLARLTQIDLNPEEESGDGVREVTEVQGEAEYTALL